MKHPLCIKGMPQQLHTSAQPEEPTALTLPCDYSLSMLTSVIIPETMPTISHFPRGLGAHSSKL